MTTHGGGRALGRKMTVAIALAAMASQWAMAQEPLPLSDFARSMSQSDQYEIQAAYVVLVQNQNPKVRDFARQMITDHGQERDSLQKAISAAHGIPLPPSMTSEQSMMLAALQSLRGAELDRVYIRQQIMAHHQALAVFRSYATAGTDENLRQLAQSGEAATKRHLEMAEQVRVALAGS